MSAILSTQIYPLTAAAESETFDLHDPAFADLAFVNDDSGDDFLYALLEPEKIPLLEDRIAAANLTGIALYRRSTQAAQTEPYATEPTGPEDEDYSGHGPWLVQLGERDLMTTAILSGTLGDWDQRHLLTAGAGLLLRSALGPGALANHLRRYIRLTETDTGAALFFRMQEPGFLPALLGVSSPEVVAGFFTGVRAMLFWRRSFETAAGELVETTIDPQHLTPALADWLAQHSVPPADGAPLAPAAKVAFPGLGPVERQALKWALFERQARDLAIADATDPEERLSRYHTYFRLLRAGFENPQGLAETWEIARRLPTEALPGFWATVESGAYSLRFIVVNFAGDYGLQEFLNQ